MDDRRKRTCNFTAKEEMLLLNCVEYDRNIIECKLINARSVKEKDRAWDRLCVKFNTYNPIFRTKSQLRAKYDNLRSKARKYSLARNHLTAEADGSIPNGTAETDPVAEKVLEIIGPNWKPPPQVAKEASRLSSASDPLRLNQSSKLIPTNNIKVEVENSPPYVMDELSMSPNLSPVPELTPGSPDNSSDQADHRNSSPKGRKRKSLNEDQLDEYHEMKMKILNYEVEERKLRMTTLNLEIEERQLRIKLLENQITEGEARFQWDREKREMETQESNTNNDE